MHILLFHNIIEHQLIDRNNKGKQSEKKKTNKQRMSTLKKSDFEQQFAGFSKVSKAIDAKDQTQFEKLSFALRRTKSNSLYNTGFKKDQRPRGQRRFSYNDRFSYQNKSDSIYVVSIPIIPRDFLSVKDDNNLFLQKPDKYIDYLSFNWEIWDLLMTWKFLLKWKQFLNSEFVWFTNNMKNLHIIIRLENIIWRLYFKFHSGIENRTLVNSQNLINFEYNWIKDNELCWLYGPLILYKNNFESPTYNAIDQNTNKSVHSLNRKIKPILKKEKIDRIMLKNSLWKLNQLKLVLSTETVTTATVSECCSSESSESISYSQSKYMINSLSLLEEIPKITSILKNSSCCNTNKSADNSKRRHIKFNNIVKQCAPISNSVSPGASLLTIRYLSNTCLNIYPENDDDSSQRDEKNNAVSHNFKTVNNYSYKYGYDYNSVYTKNIEDYLHYTPVMEKNSLVLEQGTRNKTVDRSCEKDSESELFLHVQPHRSLLRKNSPLYMSKRRNFITGDIIKGSGDIPTCFDKQQQDNDNNESSRWTTSEEPNFNSFNDTQEENNSRSSSVVISSPATMFHSTSSISIDSGKFNNIKTMSTFQLTSLDRNESNLNFRSESDHDRYSNKQKDVFFTSSQFIE